MEQLIFISPALNKCDLTFGDTQMTLKKCFAEMNMSKKVEKQSNGS